MNYDVNDLAKRWNAEEPNEHRVAHTLHVIPTAWEKCVFFFSVIIMEQRNHILNIFLNDVYDVHIT